MKTKKVLKKGKKEDFGKDRSSTAKVVKEKRPGKPIMSSLEEDEDAKPLRPTTNSFFDEDYDANNDDDDDGDDDDDDDDSDEDSEEDEEELEEFQKIR